MNWLWASDYSPLLSLSVHYPLTNYWAFPLFAYKHHKVVDDAMNRKMHVTRLNVLCRNYDSL